LNEKNNVQLILIQINEAHSSEWTKHLKDEPEPQKSYQDRLDRTKLFLEKYQISKYPFIEVYIDGWNDKADNLYQLWPDKYYLVDKENKIVKKSEYGTEGMMEAVILEDYLDVLVRLTE
jgi:hypothetical protein